MDFKQRRRNENGEPAKKLLMVDFDAKKEKIPPCDYYCDTLYLLPYTAFVKLPSENKEAASETSSTISSDTEVNGRLEVIADKGHETYQIEGEKRDFFDDREECREALQYVDDLHQAGIDTSEFPWRLCIVPSLQLWHSLSTL
ncbi:hypothetical protein P8452_26571 [Trifolium repens]|nr:hypothetical protein P8452_26571 [Trifolium repens]